MTILIHPDNLSLLYKARREAEVGDYSNLCSPFKIVTDVNVPKYIKRWQFPKNRYIEHEKSDEAWARPLGIGRLVDTTDIALFMINDSRSFI